MLLFVKYYGNIFTAYTAVKRFLKYYFISYTMRQ